MSRSWVVFFFLYYNTQVEVKLYKAQIVSIVGDEVWKHSTLVDEIYN